jgi:hypothetical protein
MRRRQGQILVIVLAVVVVIAAAGCGGKKKSSVTSTSTAAATTTTTTTAPASTAATTTPATSSSSGGGNTSTNGLAALASAANCKSIADIGQAFAQAIQGTNGNVQKDAELFKEFADKTPSDIRPAFQTVAAALAKVANALKGVNLGSGKAPDAATIAKLEQLGTQINSPAVQKAETQISDWAAKNCHA